MISVRQQRVPTASLARLLGSDWVDSTQVPTLSINLLFGALILTVASVFLAGNLMARNSTVFTSSGMVSLWCVGAVCFFYAATLMTRSIGWGLVSTCLLLTLPVAFNSRFTVMFVGAVMVVGALSVARLWRLPRGDWSRMLMMAAVSVLVILGVRTGYTSFDMMSRLRLDLVHQDTLYHASIAAMIKNYGAVSTGLHGLVETPYHVFSHVLLAGISALSDVSVLEVYGIAPWVLFAPLLLFSVTALYAIVAHDRATHIAAFWVVASITCTVTPLLLNRWCFWESFFISESYLVSLPLFIVSGASYFKRKLSFGDQGLIIVSAPLIGAAKASVGVLFAVLWMTRCFIKWRTLDRGDFVAAVGAGTCVFLAVAAAASANGDHITFRPLHFAQTYAWGGHNIGAAFDGARQGVMVDVRVLGRALVSATLFFLFHFVWSWMLLLLMLSHREEGVLHRMPLAGFVGGVLFVGVAVSALLGIPGGSAGYFTNVAFFVSMPFVVAYFVDGFWRVVSNRNALAVLSLCLLGGLSWNAFEVWRDVAWVRASQARQVDSSDRKEFVAMLEDLRRNGPGGVIYRLDGGADGSEVVSRCSARPFVFPAVTEHAWVGVIRGGASKCGYRYYGYGEYAIGEDGQIGRDAVFPSGAQFVGVRF